MSINFRHIGLLTGYTLRHQLRSGSGIIYFLSVLLIGFTITSFYVLPLQKDLSANESKSFAQDKAEAIGKFTAAMVITTRIDETFETAQSKEAMRKWQDYLIEEKPAILSTILLFLLLLFPSMCLVGASNQTASDAGNRSLRYLLLRTERLNIFFSRFLAAFGLTAIVWFIFIALLATYLALTVPFHTTSSLFLWGLQGFIKYIIIAVPYIALCAMVSAKLSSSRISLGICLFIISALPVVILFMGKYYPIVDYLRHLTPNGIQARLFHNEPIQVGLAALACLAYTTVFLTAGALIFKKRDL